MENRMTYAEKKNRLKRIEDKLESIVKTAEEDPEKYNDHKNSYEVLITDLVREHMMTQVGLR